MLSLVARVDAAGILAGGLDSVRCCWTPAVTPAVTPAAAPDGEEEKVVVAEVTGSGGDTCVNFEKKFFYFKIKKKTHDSIE